MDFVTLLPILVVVVGAICGGGFVAFWRVGAQNRLDNANAANADAKTAAERNKSTLEGMQMLLTARDKDLTDTQANEQRLLARVRQLELALTAAGVPIPSPEGAPG